MSNPIYVFDFTLKDEGDDTKIALHGWLKKYCKKYSYQLETSESGYAHFQGRVSLKEKLRIGTLINKSKDELKGIHWSITSDCNKDNDFYVTKEETRIAGPWSDKDKEVYIPKQYRTDKLLPWQQTIFDRRDEWDTRHVNFVLEEEGNKGKSFLVGYMCCNGYSQKIPYMDNIKDIMRMIMDTEKKRIYFIDFPRGLGKDRLASFMSGVEEIKNGYCYDDRYTFKQEWFDSPNIWIFSNKLPKQELLSLDRWIVWRIIKNHLVRVCDHDEEYGKYE